MNLSPHKYTKTLKILQKTDMDSRNYFLPISAKLLATLKLQLSIKQAADLSKDIQRLAKDDKVEQNS